jgi:hypothetical protein
MLQQINDNLYPINIVYYTNKLKTYMMKEGRLEALKTCKDSITEDVNSFEQVQCRANLLKAYLTSSSIDNADEITTLKNELEAAVTKRNTEGFNYNIF